MRIGVDARELAGRPTGVGRYLSGLLRQWTTSTDARGHEFLLYVPTMTETHAVSSTVEGAHLVPACPEALVPGIRVLAGAGGTLWEQRDLPRAAGRDRVDVLFSPAYSTPLFTRIARVVALHDVSFAAHPEWFRWREGIRRRVLARRSAAAARAVVTISQFSKNEIARHLGVDDRRVHVIPPGLDAPAGCSAGTGRADSIVLLFVGSVFNRRHVPDLIRAFARVARHHPDASLHIVGENRTHPHQDLQRVIAAEQVGSQVCCHQYVQEAQLQDLYARARAFAFLSEYEGLGLTPLEALGAGIPSVLLDTPVARESCGDAAAYVPTTTVADVAPAIERMLYDDPARRTVLAAAPGVVGRYVWARAAADTLRVITGAP
jgi:glycosyltransferase involved in cell wall biosynthesis